MFFNTCQEITALVCVHVCSVKMSLCLALFLPPCLDCSNEPVGYTRLPVSELESDRQKEGEEEEKGATDLDEEMLNPVV